MTLPTNAAQAIANALNGGAGEFEQCMIGDLVVDVLVGLQVPRSLIVTSEPVQAGFNIASAAIEDPQPITIHGWFTNPEYSLGSAITAITSGSTSGFTKTWNDKKNELEEIRSSLTIVNVQTHQDIFQSYLITEIDPQYDNVEDWDGYEFIVRLEPHRINGGADEENTEYSKSSSVGGL